MKNQVLFVAISSLCYFFLSSESTACVTADLVTPKMTEGQPAAGKCVRQVSPEYRQSKVYHALYLPTDWVKGETFPVLVAFVVFERYRDQCLLFHPKLFLETAVASTKSRLYELSLEQPEFPPLDLR